MAATISVNGHTYSVDVDGDTPLLWVLRDVLGMTGTKFGCGMALCGACTVHIDGVATRSCVTPIDSVGASKITTIEAIGATATGARIQKAWLDREVVQCGYCQSGQIMSASALLASNPIRRIPISTMRCPATSAAAGPMSEFAKRSSKPRNPPEGRLTMILDRIASRPPSRTNLRSANDLSRRRFLQAGAAAGGGLMLSLSLPLRTVSRSGRRRRLRAERLHPHRPRRPDRPDHALCRDGPGRLHRDLDADRRRAGSGTETNPAGACAAQREAVRQSPARRGAGDGRIDRNCAAWQPMREAGAIARTMLCPRRRALECRAGVLPGKVGKCFIRRQGEAHVW